VKVGATGSTRLQRDTQDMEADLGVRSFPPVEIFSFLAASFRGKKSFLTGETVSLVLLLFPHFISLPCHLLLRRHLIY
jgi:hypothetical protein